MIKKISYGCLVLFTVLACKKKADTNVNKEEAISVKTEKVETMLESNTISISGNIEGSTTVRLGFLVAGKVDFISIKEGQNINKGKLIASLDPTNYGIAKEMADVQVNSTKDEYNRLKTMYDRNSISDGDFSKITFGLQQAKAQQKLQAKNLADTKLYSPISGVLLKKMTEIGEIVSEGTPQFVVADIRKVKVIAFIPEGELHNITLGQEAGVYISSLNEIYGGKVIEVGSAADATTRGFAVKIELQNPKLLIRPGMIAEIKLNSIKQKEMISLPVETILHDQDNQSYVFVVDEKQSKAFKRKISVGTIADNRVSITAGLTVGETVVISGQTKLNDGASILINR